MNKSLIVQKYGGTSVGTLERIERAVIRYGEDVGDQWIKEVAHAALEAVGSTLPR